MKKILSLLFFISLASQAQTDNYSKNSKTSDSLKNIYTEELKKSPNSSIPHWNHANRISKVKFNLSKQAPKFYIKAIEIDSTNSKIYKDFGDYCFNIKDYESAYLCYMEGKKYSSNDSDFDKKIEKIKTANNEKNEYWTLHKLPVIDNTKFKDYEKINHNVLTDYDNLNKKTKKGKYEYSKLVKAFNKNPKKLNPVQMFYLLYGQTLQSYYSPYNYKDEQLIQKLTKSNDIDKAIYTAENVLSIEPLNILVLRELLYCYRVKKNLKKTNEIENKLVKIFEGILISGDGSCQKPYITFSVQEEYPIVVYLGNTPVKVVDSQTKCNSFMTDKMLVRNKENEDMFIHFNYTPILNWAQSKM
jgi:hypothetical protein